MKAVQFARNWTSCVTSTPAQTVINSVRVKVEITKCTEMVTDEFRQTGVDIVERIISMEEA